MRWVGLGCSEVDLVVLGWVGLGVTKMYASKCDKINGSLKILYVRDVSMD